MKSTDALTAPVQPQGASLTVLIVEPNQDSASMYVEYLRAQGLRVVCDGDSNADGVLPDVVVFGTRSCAEHSSAVRVVRRGHPVPTIAISSDKRDRTRPLPNGFARVLIRPVHLDLLLREIRHAASPTQSSLPEKSPVPEVCDAEYDRMLSSVRREEAQQLRADCEKMRERSKALRNNCATLRQKSSSLLRQSQLVAERLQRRS